MNHPARVSAARQALEKASTVQEVKQVIDLAEAARVLAHKAQLGMETANEAAEIRFRAERKAGQMLIEMEKSGERATGANGRPKKASQVVTLSSLNIYRMEAQRWRNVAALDEPTFEATITAALKHDPPVELSQAAFLAVAANIKYEKRRAAFIESGASTVGVDDPWQMVHGDFRDVLAGLEPGSVDAIVTDPPYGDDALAIWNDLAAAAAHVLAPRGVLVAWSGQVRLPDVTAALGGHLRYGWTFCLEMPGSQSRFIAANVFQGWKPILVYLKDTWPPHDWGSDVVTSPKRTKGRYEWEQNGAPAVELIERLAGPGLVVDPFTGTGTFGMAALRAGRRFLGVELDEARYIEACRRLEGMS